MTSLDHRPAVAAPSRLAHRLVPLKWFGTATGIAGAFTVAANLPLSGWGFVLFLGSSLSWGAVGVIARDRPLWLLQAAFTAANIVGIWRWLL